MPSNNKNILEKEITENSATFTEDFNNTHSNLIETVEDPTLTEQESDEIVGSKPKKKGRLGKIISVTLILISLVFLGFGAVLAYQFTATANESFGLGTNQNTFQQVTNLFGALTNTAKRAEIKGEKDGRTNFLLIGTDISAGLTDTIMIASYYYNEKKLVTVNIPRDTQAFDGYETSKINAVFNNAIIRSREKDPAKRDTIGAEALSKLINKEFGINIDYWAKVNFEGVKGIVDELGGVDITVKNELVDPLYPNDGYRVINGSPYMRPVVRFSPGLQHMDGKTALIFARSRETTSDFDRAERQSMVVQAVLEKIKTQGVFENVSKINSYLGILGNNFRTSLQLDEIGSLSQILKENDIKNSFLRIVWATDNGFLCSKSSPETGYVIQYCGGSVIGKAQVSPARTKAVNQIQNLLAEATKVKLFDSKVVLIGNQSSDINRAYNEFQKVGFTNVIISNSTKSITPIKKGTTPNTTMYIVDPEIRKLYDDLSNKPVINFPILSSVPDTIQIPKGLEGASIMIWSE